MSERPELNAVDRTVVDELDEQTEWLWREAIVENPSEAKWIRVDGEEPGD